MLRYLIPAVAVCALSLPNVCAAEGKPPITPNEAQRELLIKAGTGWTFAGCAVSACDDEQITLAAPTGRIMVASTVLSASASAQVLSAILAQAQAAKLMGDSDFIMHPLLGLALRSQGNMAWVVTDAGALTAQAAPPARATGAEVQAIVKAGDDFLKAIDNDRSANAPDKRGRIALAELVGLLSMERADRKFDEITPEVARRMVRGGYLDQFTTVPAQAKALRQAVERASQLIATKILANSSGSLRLEQLKNAFNHTVEVGTTPQATTYAVPHAKANYSQPIVGTVVVELSAGATVAAAASRVVGARLFVNDALVARWSRSAGFTAVNKKQETAVGPDSKIKFGSFPAHIMLSNVHGDPLALAVPGGLLPAVADSSTAEADRFLTNAAKTLPTMAYLDLVGQYFVYYTYDSPDTRYPLMAGSKSVRGDIHSTAVQTLSTSAFGQCRGDCDDVAELYQEISNRQNRLGHVASLPGHAAYFAAEKLNEGWKVQVLQTGPRREFSAPRLPEALRKAYASFSENVPVDPDGLGLLLRFNGENTRGNWRLGWRIFAEPDYAKTMIDVQRDWHLHTYARGIDKMKKLVAAGDSDPANYSELSGLYNFTGQYEQAVDLMLQSLAKQPENGAKLMRKIELVGLLRQAKQTQQAATLIGELTKKLSEPAIAKPLGEGVFQVGLALAGQANAMKRSDLSTRLLDTTLKPLARHMDGVAAFVESNFDENRWEHQMEAVRRILSGYAGTNLGAVLSVPSASRSTPSLQRAQEIARKWSEKISFRDIDDPGEVFARYAFLAQVMALSEDEEALAKEIAAAPWPSKAKIEHHVRSDGPEQRARDLSWIRMSVPWWYGRLMKVSGGDHDESTRDDESDATVNAAKIRQAVQGLTDAMAMGEKLGITSSMNQFMSHMAQLELGLLCKDEAALKACLKRVVSLDDKRLRDATANAIGNRAPHMDLTWFASVLDAWQAEVNYKPLWFGIAWRAGLSGAPAHAVLTGERAVKLFPEESAFAEELALMRKLYPAANK